MHRRSLAIHTFAHFAVDFACFFVLFSTVSSGIESLQQLSIWFLIYNIIAFGLQFIVGYVCDTKREFPAALIGVIIAIVGLAFTKQIYIALVLVALGNAFFHVGGGIDSLVNAKGKMSRSGVFVSSGTWGVALGTMAGSGGISIAFPLAFLAVSGVLIYLFCSPAKINMKKSEFRVNAKSISISLAIALIFVSVAVRAHTGFSIPMPWKSTTLLVLMSAFASFFGKFIGGFIGDRIGARLTGTGALLLSLPLLVFFNVNPWLCLLGIMLFNMTMPITLCAIAQYLEGYEGLAFGLTTLALLSGTFITYVYLMPQGVIKYVIAVSIAISALCILLTTGNDNRKYREELKGEQNA
ncbi:MAG: hypothetical protein AB1Z23_12620 [Eubacteriales bacterium]